MNRFHIVTEYIDYYLFKRKLTKVEFCKICEISENDFFKIENNHDYDMNVLKKISKYINVPMNFIYNDLDNDHFKPIISDFDNSLKKEESTIFFF